MQILTDAWSAAPQQPQPSLTTEYTPRERGGVPKLPSTPQPSGSGATQPTQRPPEGETPGPDPATLPPVTAPPSHPTIDPDVPGTLDGRSILEVDLNALADKAWRRPGSDISDWFNYGFDELSWEAYCYRRRETGEIASMLRNNVLVRDHVAAPFFSNVLTLPTPARAELCRDAGGSAVCAAG